MLPGPDIIIECPHCKTQMYSESIASGNTFGAELWSDGYQFAPMLPKFPDWTLCSECKRFFQVSKAREIGERESFFREKDFPPDDYREAKPVKALRIASLHKLLKDPTVKYSRDKKQIRMELLWRFNDRIRKGAEKPWKNKREEMIWNENLKELKLLSNNPQAENTLLLCEISRYEGDFEKARQYLEWTGDKDFREVKEIMEVPVEQKKRWVVRLIKND
jgi:hypothetical protein